MCVTNNDKDLIKKFDRNKVVDKIFLSKKNKISMEKIIYQSNF